ncbi:MAG TPA: dienelactone hydrolase family protein [Thermoanaerobaculia bacterium]|nr:dienelactone hydrolase family protein [Thermoanaerobaculia bacterium]
MYRIILLALIATGCVMSPADPAAARLEATPRHVEWIQIDRGDRTLVAYVTWPEVSEKAPAVLLIHENRGLTEFEHSVADQLSENGFIVIAPDMLSGMAPGGGRASDFPSLDAAREAIGKLPREQVMADLNAAADYVLALPASNGTLSVAGYCWGGARTWEFANRRAGLDAAYPFYGTGPQEASSVAGITAPVHGFYGGDDARVNATIPRTEELMRAAGKFFNPVIYEGAGHAFMRSGAMPDASPANREAWEKAWSRWLSLLRE